MKHEIQSKSSELIYDINDEQEDSNNEYYMNPKSSLRKLYKKQEIETQISQVRPSKLIKVQPVEIKPSFVPKNMNFHQLQKSDSPKEENIVFCEQQPSERNEGAYMPSMYDSNRNLFTNELKEDQQLDQSDGQDQQNIKKFEKKIDKTKTIVVDSHIQKIISQIVPLNYRFRCLISVQQNFLGLSKIYKLFYFDTLKKQKYFLLSAKKEFFSLSTTFILSRNPTQINRRNEQYRGKVDSNFGGTQFILHIGQNKSQIPKLRIKYNKNIIGINGIRTFIVTKINPFKIFKGKTKRQFANIQQIIEKGEKSKLLQLESCKPVLHQGRYTMDFKGKAKIPSTKNFILNTKSEQKQSEDNSKKQITTESLLFAKQSDDSYLMEVGFPLNIIEGFAVCLSSLDSKLLVN